MNDNSQDDPAQLSLGNIIRPTFRLFEQHGSNGAYATCCASARSAEPTKCRTERSPSAWGCSVFAAVKHALLCCRHLGPLGASLKERKPQN